MADPRSWNRYAYVRNSPLSLIDPVGLDCVYLNASGTGIEENGIDQESEGELFCRADGGLWVDGSLTQATFSSDGVNADLQGTTNGTNATFHSYCDCYQNYLMGALPEAYVVGQTGVNYVTAFTGVEIAITAGAFAWPVVIPVVAEWNAQITVGVAVTVGWEPVYEFVQGLNDPIPPATLAGELGGEAGWWIQKALGIQ